MKFLLMMRNKVLCHGCLFFLICVNLFCTTTANAFQATDISFNQKNTAYTLYNYVLPTLMRFVAYDPKDSPETKIVKTIRYVNFFATPDHFQNLYGYNLSSQNLGWWDDLSFWFVTGYILCSEQAGIAVKMLGPWFEHFAFRDVYAHTFFEVLHNNRWIILDPMFDVRYTNRHGELLTFQDVQASIEKGFEGKDFEQPITEKTTNYFNRYKIENIQTNEVQRHKYGEHILWPDNIQESYNHYRKFNNATTMLEWLHKNGSCEPEKETCLQYYDYIRNKIHDKLMHSKHLREDIAAFQDYFFKAIDSKFDDAKFEELYRARNMLLLGRTQESLQLLNDIPQNDLACYSKAQIYYLQRNIDEFNQLSSLLKGIRAYRYMYWQLNGVFLLPDDETELSAFDYRSFGLDRVSNRGLYQLEILQ